jgi:DNA-binding NtrC family response regulator
MKKRLLIVDDMNGWRNFHKEFLQNFYNDDIEIQTANSAKEAYDTVYNNLNTPFDLIITDLQMELDFEPKHAGEWLVEQIQKLNQFNNKKIIIISATYNIKSIAENLNVNFLPKSVITRDLAAYKTLLEKINF